MDSAHPSATIPYPPSFIIHYYGSGWALLVLSICYCWPNSRLGRPVRVYDDLLFCFADHQGNMPLLCFASCFGGKQGTKSPERGIPANFPGAEAVKKELFVDNPIRVSAQTTSTHEGAPPALQTTALPESPLCEPCKTYRAHVPVEVSVVSQISPKSPFPPSSLRHAQPLTPSG